MRIACLSLAAALLVCMAPTPANAQWHPGPGPGLGYGGPGPDFGAPGPGYSAPGPGFGGAYRSPFPPSAWGGPVAPGFAPPGWSPYPGVPNVPPTLQEPRTTPTYVPLGQSHIARPDPFGPPVRIEPRAKEVAVGGVTARRYDYSFDVSPLPAPGYDRDDGAGFPGNRAGW
ncbi:hypothetical protein [Alienimonas chondri]|uniref:hypothetical protein n=1 Tax=Alienimonas chondri TaxID=2681879 RepID=UPI0014891931|nr:hypothetical protein [Alienimonas chondri]